MSDTRESGLLSVEPSYDEGPTEPTISGRPTTQWPEEGERACGPAVNPYRPSRTVFHSLGEQVRRKTLQTALQVLQVLLAGCGVISLSRTLERLRGDVYRNSYSFECTISLFTW